MKIDPYNHKEKYLKWRESAKQSIEGISEKNQKIILNYLDDMENGTNTARGSQKGARSYARLNSLRARMCFFAQQFSSLYKLDNITESTEEQVIDFFSGMRKGKIKKRGGGEFKSMNTYAKIFRAFWHWHQKVNKKKDIEIKDISADLDTSGEKPDWVYLTEDEVRRNLLYARACVRDCLVRGEIPFASHLFYTQPRILDDNIPEERNLGINAGKLMIESLPRISTVVYQDLGISSGMKFGIAHAKEKKRAIEYRTLEERWLEKEMQIAGRHSHAAIWGFNPNR